MIVNRNGPLRGIESEPGTAFLRRAWKRERAEGKTDLGFTAWARAAGIVVSSDHGWDDLRRRPRVSLDQAIATEE